MAAPLQPDHSAHVQHLIQTPGSVQVLTPMVFNTHVNQNTSIKPFWLPYKENLENV